MKPLEAARRILGIDITRDRKRGTLSLSQSGYLKKVISLFDMEGCKPVSTPIPPHFKLQAVKGNLPKEEADYMKKVPYSNAVGSLMYAMISTRPDIAYGVSLVSRFMCNPSKEHWSAVKWVLRYLKGSVNKGLVFGSNAENSSSIKGFCDSDFAADLDKRRSLSGYVFTLGGNLISWKANLQHIVALSTTEAEYVALTEAMKEAI
ncbi:secreted RxLR effector protein 161-like [Diospyros lotus]|uniref:secreted RxLR effector protein 161-like n=1 Tax=Diospyros lotus TaxID=55363 RepID=UPI0022518E05|nr:secreted RxLR effector protein 161-like [Diospyros lotus]